MKRKGDFLLCLSYFCFGVSIANPNVLIGFSSLMIGIELSIISYILNKEQEKLKVDTNSEPMEEKK